MPIPQVARTSLRVMVQIGGSLPGMEAACTSLVQKDRYRRPFRIPVGPTACEVHRQPVAVPVRAWSTNISFAFRSRLLCRCRTSGSVVPAWGIWRRRVPRKSTDGWPGASFVAGDGGPFLGRKLLIEVTASIRVPSTLKCSSDSKLSASAPHTTSSTRARRASCASSHYRFLVNTRGIEAALDQAHVQEPAERQVVCEFHAEGALAAHRVQGNQQRGCRQPLGRYRGPAHLGVHAVERRRQTRQGRVGHRLDPSQGMVLQHPLPGATMASIVRWALGRPRMESASRLDDACPSRRRLGAVCCGCYDSGHTDKS